MVVSLIAAVSGLFMLAGVYREKVNNLEDEIVLIRQLLQDVQNWQRDWPIKGELILDRGQNAKIEDLLRRVNLLEQ